MTLLGIKPIQSVTCPIQNFKGVGVIKSYPFFFVHIYIYIVCSLPGYRVWKYFGKILPRGEVNFFKGRKGNTSGGNPYF